ncbi:MAG: Holliday junction branch migration protein RuvA [Ruminococcaceae bacterium]|nr:Holliday junction branch migration protein RuvA [Oscillospiraceae bacterium]
MIGYVKGKLAEKELTFAIIDVNGIGFKIFTSLTSLESVNVGDDVTFHTYLYIKEGIMDLYGFSTKEELKMFELLISVSGVGAKGAIAILSVGSPSKIAVAIATSDINLIKSASGIGPKIAQRIALELKDKISNEELSHGVVSDDVPVISKGAKNEAISALMVLGYSKGEAEKAVANAKCESDDVEEIIKAALKALM